MEEKQGLAGRGRVGEAAQVGGRFGVANGGAGGGDGVAVCGGVWEVEKMGWQVGEIFFLFLIFRAN